MNGKKLNDKIIIFIILAFSETLDFIEQSAESLVIREFCFATECY